MVIRVPCPSAPSYILSLVSSTCNSVKLRVESADETYGLLSANAMYSIAGFEIFLTGVFQDSCFGLPTANIQE